MSDGAHCPITGGVGLLEPIGSPKAGHGPKQVWLRRDRSCSLSPELASVEAAATTCGGGGGEEVSAHGAAHLPLPAAGGSRWACCGAAAGDAYIRAVRATAARASRVTAGGDSCGRCARRVAPPLPSPLVGDGRRGSVPPSHPRSGDPLDPGPSLREHPSLSGSSRALSIPRPWRPAAALFLLSGPFCRWRN